jgi:hypothetical protein
MREDFFGAVWRRTAMLNQKMVDITYINLHFAFELARAKTFSDVLTLQADYWQKLFGALQGEQLRFKAAEPQPAVNQEESLEKELSQPKRKDESSPFVDIANQQPKRRPVQRPMQSAGARTRKAEKSRGWR